MPRRVEFTKAGSPSTIRIAEMPMPEPKTGEVRVKVAFAGINFADLLMRLGFYQPRPPYPFTPGYEVSGVIDAVGDEKTGFTVGQRVVAAIRCCSSHARDLSYSPPYAASFGSYGQR